MSCDTNPAVLLSQTTNIGRTSPLASAKDADESFSSVTPNSVDQDVVTDMITSMLVGRYYAVTAFCPVGIDHGRE